MMTGEESEAVAPAGNDADPSHLEPLARIAGEPVSDLPQDLYIPPEGWR